MTITLDLPPTVSGELQKVADHRGITLDQLVVVIVTEYLTTQASLLATGASYLKVLSGEAAVFSPEEIQQMLYDPSAPADGGVASD